MSCQTKKPLAVATSLLIAIAAMPAMASDADKIRALELRLEALQKELNELKSAVKQKQQFKFSKSSPAPELVSSDGQSALEFKARFQADYVDADEMLTGKDASYTPAEKDTSIRRFRLGLEGKFAKEWEYELEVDFSDDEVEVKDANIAFKGWDDQILSLGFQKYAFGLSNTQSSAHQIMMERASVDTFAPDRALGLQWRYLGENWTFSTGVGLDYSEIEEDDTSSYEETRFITNRLTYAPINEKSSLVHLGTSYMMLDLGRDNKELRYRARPGSKPTNRMVETEKFASDGSDNFGVEGILKHQNLLFLAEYMLSSADKLEGGSVDVDAYNLTASYVLTGEQWRYSSKKGSMKSPRPEKSLSEGGWGAWEVAIRYDKANFLEDELTYGGDLTTLILGTNWYLEDNLKLQFNYIDAEATNKVDAEYIDQDTKIWQTRLHFGF
ncbi:porin [Catenovulum sp. SM1970]|uniref:OprO/OprP family phosphate-selective porin n=1 Tax=Marinifaba aquimaris TaxID=2741323 RepID=UPI001572D68D|nr:porin [Marinifaba aquimaris]NTS78023.1 porin [Marinifaba aquimaris]